MPFAPNVATVSSDGPVPEQSAGTVGYAAEPMICTGRSLAVSPPMVRSALATGPQE
jgi:hypothetical protein